MRYAIITVAGLSERFNKGYDNPMLKCIYYTNDEKLTLLYSILEKCQGMDKIIIVGGFQYDLLREYVKKYSGDFPFEIELVYNEKFSKYGSGYSLYKGIQICYERKDFSEIIFVEGDLYFDKKTFDEIKTSTYNVITTNDEAICSNKAVALYINAENKIRYIYNTSHGLFKITEPFSEIHNSGQVWKLVDKEKFYRAYESLGETDWQGTNLVFLEKYYNEIETDRIKFLRFSKWINCNSREDYKKIKDC